jgi:hypothetical protein
LVGTTPPNDQEEVGCLLGIEPPAARKRYGRALVRLQAVLTDGVLTESEL